jgi:polyferredoxin
MRSLLFIKFIHTAVFIVMNVFLAILIFEVIADRISYLSWLSIAALLTESVVLIANGWRCPISIYAENVGATNGRESDIFLPLWFTDQIPLVYGSILAIVLLFFAIRLLN